MSKYLESNPERERLKAQEKLIFTATELLSEAIEHRGVTRRELAARVGVRPGEITQRLTGSRNLTLRTLADMLHALGYGLDLELRDLAGSWSRVPRAYEDAYRRPAAVGGRGEQLRYTRTGTELRVVPSDAA
jgi:transcriptional regulator with XRE-family HTH domain